MEATTIYLDHDINLAVYRVLFRGHTLFISFDMDTSLGVGQVVSCGGCQYEICHIEVQTKPFYDFGERPFRPRRCLLVSPIAEGAV